MAKNLQVNLAFTADTNAAMQNLQTLRNSLNEISSLPFSVGKGLNQDLRTASNSAQQLQRHLGAAMDVKTGNLNLNKLQSSLKGSNQSLSQLTSGLLRAGTTGEKAFLATYSAIAQSSIQLKKSNTLLSQFALTMKNTAKWQLSSSMLHGLISGFSSAIGYAKDLDKSLNNIQIVTQQSADQMAEFAKQANKAAKELKTTTVAYTDAALIYYQQGLKGDDVTKRADTTVKLANVTGESAQTVSQWMTAVWNNFEDGSKSLEYYADVMTALGAATASSSDEIAQGLEKFAAVADTVGLSYESATAALATITATTRQSADVVGTALKTLFARIQDLDLGKTLEDGTTLGSYSEALNKVGIDIKDQSGQLKEMDDILDEMGNKWKTLDKDQQVALAKNVAGIRQYTQLIALMDNYDFYKQNQDVAAGAEGTLEQQAEIYEQSWEAASKNVKASLESMYNVLIPTDFIVDFTNGLADVVSGFTEILDAAGGLRTILLMISSVVLSKFQASISVALNTGIEKAQNLITSAKEAGNVFKLAGNKIKDSWVKSATHMEVQNDAQQKKAATGLQAQAQQGLNDALHQKDAQGNRIALSEGFVAQVKSLQQIETYNTRILNLKDQMTSAELEGFQMEQQQLKALGEQVASKKQYISDLELEKQHLIDIQSLESERIKTHTTSGGRIATSETSEILTKKDTGYDETMGYRMGAELADSYSGGDVRTKFEKDETTGESVGAMSFANEEALLQAKTQILQVVSDTAAIEAEIGAILDDNTISEAEKAQAIDSIIAKKKEEGALTEKVADELKDSVKLTKNADGSLKSASVNTGKLKATMSGVSAGVQKAAKHLGVSKEHIGQTVKLAKQQVKAQGEVNGLQGQSAQITKRIEEGLQKIVERGSSIGTVITKGTQGFSQMAMGVSMLQSAITSLGDAFKDGFDFSQFLSSLTSLGMALPILTGGFKSLMSAVASVDAVQNKANATIATQLVESELLQASKAKENTLELTQLGLEKAAQAAKATGIAQDKIELALRKLGNGAKLTDALATAGLTKAEWAQVAANIGLQASMWPILVITLLVVAAFAVLVAIVYGVTKAIQYFQSQTPEAKLKALEEAAAKSKEALQEATTAVQELADSLEGLKDSYKALENLEKGTTEWLLKVMEVNEQVTDLLKKYPELEKYVNWDKGYAELSEQGMEVAQQLANKELVTKSNIYNEDQIAVKKQQQNMLNDDYDYTEAYTVEVEKTRNIHGYQQKYTEEETRYRAQTTDLGDGASAAGYARHAFGVDVQDLTNEEDLAKLYEKKKELVGSEKEAIEEFLDDYEEHLRLQNQINNLDNQQLVSRGQQAGSTRNAEELKEIMGIDSYDDIQKNARKDVEDKFGDWNDHINYDIDNDEEGDMIKDFMKLQGEDTKYVAQRHGKMVLEIDGEEVEFTKDEVYKQLTELYSGEEFENKLKEGLQTSIGTALGGVDLSNLDLPTLNALDEIKRGFDETFSGLNLSAEQTNQKFQELAGVYSTVENGNVMFDAEQLAQDSEFIDTTSDKFQDLTQRFAEGTIGAQEFATAMREMNAEGQLDSMSEFFNTAAEGMGLGEEEAADMQNYAKHLAEVAKSSDELSDTLAEDADSAADLAIEVTKMNKGVEELAEGFEDWSSILKKSSKTSAEYSKAMSSMKSSLSKVLDVEEDLISSDFVNEHLEDIEKAAKGDAKAIDSLRAAMDEEVIANITLGQSEEFIKNVTAIESKVQDLASNLPDIEVGAVLDDADFLAAANNLVEEAGMTADEANAYFAGIGYEPVYSVEEVDTSMDSPNVETVTHTTGIGFDKSKKMKVDLGPLGSFDINAPYMKSETVSTPLPPANDGSKTRLMGISGSGTPPKIKGLRKKATGSSNNYSSKNSGGKSPGGSSGGGSSSKTATKDKKKLSSEGDFYHDINREIERLQKSTDRLADAKDRAFGDDKIDLINQEIEALEKEIQAQEDLIDRAEEKLKLDKQTLSKYGATYDKNGEITNYDEMLQNEVNKYNAAVDTYNAKAAQKDAGNLSDEEWEKAQEDFENAEERYSGFEEAVSTYETDLDIKDDAVEEAAEKARQILDLQLEGIQYSVDIQIEVNDYDLKVLEHLLDRLDDDKFDGTAKIKNMTSQMDEQFDNIEIYKAGIRQTLVSAGADQAALDAYMAGDSTAVQGLDLSEEQMNMLMDYSEGIMESEEAILELRESIEGQVMATFEAWREEIENNARAFEHATTMAQSYKDIIDLMGKSRLGIDNAILKDLEATQQKSANAYMTNAKVQMESTASALKQAQESLANAVDDESREMWQGVVDELGVQLMEDQEAFMSSWNDALQTAADNFTAQMDRAFEDLEDSLTGIFGSFDELSNYMEKQQSITDRYLNASEKTYELSKLNRKLQKDLDKTDSKKAQKELLAMQEEITAYQASGVEMSERDLQALQKKYDLKLAEIALEEAQNAKSTVRLTRDSEGNFGYVYTADENKVADAQQKYEDTLEANRQLAVSQQEELTNAIVENRQKMVEALREVRREDYEDTAAYTAALEEITAFYTEQETYLINEYQKVVQRSQLIYEEDYMSYTGWSQAKNNYTDQYYMAWQEKRRIANEIEALQSSGQWALLSEQQRAAYDQELATANEKWLALQEAQSGAYLIMGQNADGWVFTQSELMTQLGCNIMDGITNGDGSSGTNGLLAALGTVDGEGFFGEANAAALGWEQATSATLDLIGEDYSSLQTLIKNTITGENGINDIIEANKTKLGTLSKTSKNEFGKVTTEVNTWQTNYSKKVKTATSDTNNLNKAIQDLTGKSIQVIAEVKNQDKVDRLKETINSLGDKTVNIKNNTTNTITTEYKTTGDAPAAGGGGTQGDGIPQVGDTVTFESGVYTADSYGGGSSGSSGRGGAMKISLITNTNRARPYHLTTTSGGARGWVALNQISGYDTGGYTGDWGPDGKLAFLHQKELVLNAEDTENLLTAVQMIREISGQLEANAMTMKYIKTLENYGTKVNIDGQTLQQDVTIHAEFPNATNHSEIEEAFKNLTTLASQYTNRKF